MKLKKWLIENNLTVKDFAQYLDIHRTYVHKMMRGERVPSPRLMHKIKTLTNGEVKTEQEVTDV